MWRLHVAISDTNVCKRLPSAYKSISEWDVKSNSFIGMLFMNKTWGQLKRPVECWSELLPRWGPTLEILSIVTNLKISTRLIHLLAWFCWFLAMRRKIKVIKSIILNIHFEWFNFWTIFFIYSICRYTRTYFKLILFV